MASEASDKKETFQDARRVSQLDASELDTQIIEIIKTQIEKTFKYFKPHVLVKYAPEIHAVLRLVLWKFSVNSLEATIGQQLLDLRYLDVTATHQQWMNRKQKILHCMFFCGLPWLHERLTDIQELTHSYTHSDKFWKAVKWFLATIKVASLVNFLVFLVRGRYQFLLERVLGVRAVYPHPMGVRQIGFEFMYREMLWHGFAEFLFFLLPLINFRRIKNFIARSCSLKSSTLTTVSERGPGDYTECVVCGLYPTNPHHIGCSHIFCYYCIQSNYLADPSYTCPVCGHPIPSTQHISPVAITT